jgi:hypothetical protein
MDDIKISEAIRQKVLSEHGRKMANKRWEGHKRQTREEYNELQKQRHHKRKKLKFG